MDVIKKYSWNIGIILLYTLFFDLCMGVVMSFFHVRVQPVFLILALFAATLVLAMNANIKETLLSFLVVTCLITLIVLSVGSVYSNDYDGNSYHKMAVGCLANGWNPIVETSEEFSAGFFDNLRVNSVWMWVDCYGKASWYIASTIYLLTGNIESGKAYTLLSMIILCSLFYSYLEKKHEGKHVVNMFISILTICNPVFVVQALGYYVDGFLGVMLSILIIGLTMLIDYSCNKKDAWMVIVPAMSILGNIKFTGLAYGGILCIVFFLFSILEKWDRKSFKDYLFRMINFIILAIFTAVGIGYSTYVTNFLRHGNPLYPLAGKWKVDFMAINSPKGFEGKNILYRLFYSLFSNVSNLMYDESTPLPSLKIPFSTSKEEIAICGTACDMRISGFGVFFGGILILSLIIIAIWMICAIRKRNFRREHKYVLVLMITFGGLLLIISESWWARYTPYMYLIPIIAILILVYSANKVIWKIAAMVLAGILLVNDYFFFALPRWYIQESGYIEDQFSEITGKKLVVINEEEFPGLFFNLEDHGVEYTILYDESILGEKSIYYGYLKYAED